MKWIISDMKNIKLVIKTLLGVMEKILSLRFTRAQFSSPLELPQQEFLPVFS
jgi:hypothetical protein